MGSLRRTFQNGNPIYILGAAREKNISAVPDSGKTVLQSVLRRVYQNIKSRKKSGDNDTCLGEGVDLEKVSKVVPLYLSDDVRRGHFGCFGTTR